MFMQTVSEENTKSLPRNMANHLANETRNVGDIENNIKNTAINCIKAQAMLNTKGFCFICNFQY